MFANMLCLIYCLWIVMMAHKSRRSREHTSLTILIQFHLYSCFYQAWHQPSNSTFFPWSNISIERAYFFFYDFIRSMMKWSCHRNRNDQCAWWKKSHRSKMVMMIRLTAMSFFVWFHLIETSDNQIEEVKSIEFLPRTKRKKLEIH